MAIGYSQCTCCMDMYYSVSVSVRVCVCVAVGGTCGPSHAIYVPIIIWVGPTSKAPTLYSTDIGHRPLGSHEHRDWLFEKEASYL